MNQQVQRVTTIACLIHSGEGRVYIYLEGEYLGMEGVIVQVPDIMYTLFNQSIDSGRIGTGNWSLGREYFEIKKQFNHVILKRHAPG